MSKNRPKLLAVASGGGHWVQMLRLEPLFADYEVDTPTPTHLPRGRLLVFGGDGFTALVGILSGLLTVGLAYTTALWLAVLLWAICSGLGVLFNINTGSLRQAIVPNQMLGRVISIAMVLAWSANPIGALAGGLLIERTGDVRLVYAVIGIVTFLIALVFRVASPLGHAERYLTPTGSVAAK